MRKRPALKWFATTATRIFVYKRSKIFSRMRRVDPMPPTQAHEISAARRLDNVRYAIRDLACVADEVTKQGHKVLPLNVGDPLNFDFQTPPHIIEAVYKAMREGKNGYAPSPGSPNSLTSNASSRLTPAASC